MDPCFCRNFHLVPCDRYARCYRLNPVAVSRSPRNHFAAIYALRVTNNAMLVSLAPRTTMPAVIRTANCDAIKEPPAVTRTRHAAKTANSCPAESSAGNKSTPPANGKPGAPARMPSAQNLRPWKTAPFVRSVDNAAMENAVQFPIAFLN